MSDFSTAEDLIKGGLLKAGEVDNGRSKFQENAINFFNQCYIDVLSGSSKYHLNFGHPWFWAIERDQKFVNLLPAYSSGQVTLTNGSVNGSFSVAPSLSMAGRHLRLDDSDEVYVISSHTAGETSFALSVNFVGSSGGYTFEAIKFIYDLGSDVLRLASQFEGFKKNDIYESGFHVEGIDLTTFRRNFPMVTLGQGMPDRFAVLSQREGKFEVIFNGYVKEETILTIDWVKVPERVTSVNMSTYYPIVPIQHRAVLEYLIASEIQFNLKGSPADGSIMLNLGKATLQSMIEENNRQLKNTSVNRGRIIPRRDLITERRRIRR